MEFLAAQSGGSDKRNGSSDATVEIAGISAQKLKYLEVLFKLPWSVRLNDANGFPLGTEGLVIRVPNPAAYVMQKVLVGPSQPGPSALQGLSLRDRAVLSLCAQSGNQAVVLPSGVGDAPANNDWFSLPDEVLHRLAGR